MKKDPIALLQTSMNQSHINKPQKKMASLHFINGVFQNQQRNWFAISTN